MRDEDLREPLAGKLEDLPELKAFSLGEGVVKRIVFGPGRFFNDYVVRFFTLPPNRMISEHQHEWPHYLITLEGHGQVIIEGVTWDLPEKSWAFVPPNVPHSYGNASDKPFRFLCIVPWFGDPDGKRARTRLERAKSE
ncbi:Cupin domain protein [Acetomicrobium thermoterrenum DSM 13490]|uniref:Cupin domain protein n=1 Tax=Acetomicrobium thermoterrenum DSM 13490 TaxID=1120987 RepID=A0A1H3ET40_9BACT|nr:cupin domain-containing protein [Acetomicrobium thermoterrenum]SDX81922.1 Cupin domain protein [Acetomicrobium thermoterrenum DSM 13490]